MLSTCNRAEIYAAGDTEATAEALEQFFSDYHGVPHAQIAEHLYTRKGCGCGAPPVPRRRRPRLAGRRRAADPRPGEGSVLHGHRPALHRRAHQPAVPRGVRGRQARAHRHRPRRRRRVGQLRRHRAGEEDFRRPQGLERPDPRRRRDGQAHRRAPAGAAGATRSRSPAARCRPRRISRRTSAGIAVAVDRARPGARGRRHRRHRDRRDRARADARAHRRDHAAPPQPPAVHHRHRAAARRRGGRRRISTRCSSTTSTTCSRS